MRAELEAGGAGPAAPHPFPLWELCWSVLIQPLLLAPDLLDIPQPLLRVIPRIYTPVATLVWILFHGINYAVRL